MKNVNHNGGGSFVIGEDGKHQLVERTKDRHDTSSTEPQQTISEGESSVAASVSADQVSQATIKPKKAS
jgi:hypothetical protein